MMWRESAACGVTVMGLVMGLVAMISAPSIATAQAASQGPPVVLAPHRAVYDFTLSRSSGGGISEMTGRMVYELTGSACDGYSETRRFVTRGTSADGSTSISDMRFSSFEDATAQSFKFSSSEYQDQKLSDQTSGDAERKKEGGVSVALKRPTTKTLALKSDVLFPVQHTIRVIESALRSEQFFRADIYDGSDKGDKVFSTLTVIGAAKPTGYNANLPKVANADRLDKLRAWAVAMSYFDPAAVPSDAAPRYEFGFVFFENGVARRLTLDYGQFALKGELTEISFQEPAACDPKKR